MAFPTSVTTFAGFISTHSLSQDNHAPQHNIEQTDITALENKMGTGASTPTSNNVLRGNGTGTSAWAPVNVATDVTGVMSQGNGGTGTNLSTGTGATVYAVAPALTGGGSWSGSPTLSTPTIVDFTNATHNHQANAGGGMLNAANAIQSATLKAAQMFKGLIYRRQGNTSGDAAWGGNGNGGTTNTDTSAKDGFIQCGIIPCSSQTTAVTFPTAFTYTPIIICTPEGSGGNTSAFYVVLETNAGFSIVAEVFGNILSYRWVAIGQ